MQHMAPAYAPVARRIAPVPCVIAVALLGACGGADAPTSAQTSGAPAPAPTGPVMPNVAPAAPSTGPTPPAPSPPTPTGPVTPSEPAPSAEDAGAPVPGPAGEPAAGDVAATFETLRFVIMQAPCLGAGCHNDEQNPLNLRLDDELHARLTTRVSEHCGNLPVVNPGKPAESALVAILKGPCGPTPRMPLGCVADADGTCLPPEYIAAIERWIADGAPP